MSLPLPPSQVPSHHRSTSIRTGGGTAVRFTFCIRLHAFLFPTGSHPPRLPILLASDSYLNTTELQPPAASCKLSSPSASTSSASNRAKIPSMSSWATSHLPSTSMAQRYSSLLISPSPSRSSRANWRRLILCGGSVRRAGQGCLSSTTQRGLSASKWRGSLVV